MHSDIYKYTKYIFLSFNIHTNFFQYYENMICFAADIVILKVMLLNIDDKLI